MRRPQPSGVALSAVLGVDLPTAGDLRPCRPPRREGIVDSVTPSNPVGEAEGELVELGRDECLHLLAGDVVGRVIFTDSALPAAQPVNYVVDGDEVLFRTAGGSKLAAATRNVVVAFEVDDIDRSTSTGWSVLAVGQAYEVTDADRLARLGGAGPAPWIARRSAHLIAIPLVRLTGRRISPFT